MAWFLERTAFYAVWRFTFPYFQSFGRLLVWQSWLGCNKWGDRDITIIHTWQFQNRFSSRPYKMCSFLISCMKFVHDILCAKQTELENSLENLEKVLVHAEVTCRYNIRSLACFDSHASDRNRSSLQQIIRYQCKFTKFEQKIDKLNK